MLPTSRFNSFISHIQKPNFDLGTPIFSHKQSHSDEISQEKVGF